MQRGTLCTPLTPYVYWGFGFHFFKPYPHKQKNSPGKTTVIGLSLHSFPCSYILEAKLKLLTTLGEIPGMVVRTPITKFEVLGYQYLCGGAYH